LSLLGLSRTLRASGKLKVVKKKYSNLFKEREIFFYRHTYNFHVVLDNKYRYFFIFRNHNGSFCSRIMINKMISLSPNVCAPSRFKYFYLDLIVCGLDPRCHSATSIGVKPTSSFRKARILSVLSNPASCKSLSRVPIF